MKQHVSMVAMAMCVVLMGVAPAAGQTAPADAAEWEVPRMPNGRPDLQGVWANNAATPLERPEALADRGALSDEEVAALTQHARELFNGETDAAFGDSVFNAALAQSQGFTSSDAGTGNYNQFWLVDRDFENRTSLVVDPPDGRVPALTDAGPGENRRRARASTRPSGRLLHRPEQLRPLHHLPACLGYGPATTATSSSCRRPITWRS